MQYVCRLLVIYKFNSIFRGRRGEKALTKHSISVFKTSHAEIKSTFIQVLTKCHSSLLLAWWRYQLLEHYWKLSIQCEKKSIFSIIPPGHPSLSNWLLPVWLSFYDRSSIKSSENCIIKQSHLMVKELRLSCCWVSPAAQTPGVNGHFMFKPWSSYLMSHLKCIIMADPTEPFSSAPDTFQAESLQ